VKVLLVNMAKLTHWCCNYTPSNTIYSTITIWATISKDSKYYTSLQQPSNCHWHEWECEQWTLIVFTLKNHDVAFKQLVEHQKTTENVYLVCAANW